MKFDKTQGEYEEITYYPLAYLIAQDAHKDQLRDEGAPYITHIDGVIEILKNELQIESDLILSVAALHDVLEDSKKYPYELLKHTFGITLADAVLLLTHDKTIDVGLYLTSIDQREDIPWLMKIKLADRLHNLRSLQKITDQAKIKNKCRETRKYYLSFAKKHSPYLFAEIQKYLEKLERDE